MLIIHEAMARSCGWPAAATAVEYRRLLDRESFVPSLGLSRANLDIHAAFIPEMAIDPATEAARLKTVIKKRTT